MKSLQVCVIGPAQSGKTTVVSKLQQKKELETDDFQVHSFKTGDTLVYLADAPFSPDRIKPTMALMAEADACMLCVPATIDLPKLGELILLINYMNLEKGVIAITKTDSAPDRVDTLKAVLPKILAETSLKDVEIIGTSSLTDEGFTDISTALTQLQPKQRNESDKFRMGIETPQSIKSGFTTVTGVIQSGSLKKYDKTFMMPWGKEFILQEINIEGQVVESAKAGQRVDLLYKGLQAWDVQQGDVVTIEGLYEKGKTLTLDFEVSKFFKDELRTDHEVQLNIGMQTLPVNVVKIVRDSAETDRLSTGERGNVTVETKIPFAFEKGQQCIIYNPEAHWKSIKVVGSGKVMEGTA